MVGETFAKDTTPAVTHAIGWTAHPVRYDPKGAAFNGATRIGSDQAERAAMTFAGLWRLAQNTNVITVFCTDSTTTGGQAFGHLGAAEPEASYRLMRGVFQALQCALPEGHMTLHHTRAHAGDPYNEFVDLAAKAEAARSFNLPRQRLDLQKWSRHMEYFWMIFAEAYGVPVWRDGGFDVPPPDLPQSHPIEASEEAVSQTKMKWTQCALSLATANVQSLSKGPEGHAGKLHYLQAQMKAYGINCMGIQEARTEPGLRTANNVLAFASGGQDGQLGVELWINLEQPIGWQGHSKNSKALHLHRRDFCVVHGDARRLLLRCDNSNCSCWLFTSHAPHSGKSITERRTWWEETTKLLTTHCDQDPLFWLMDANAPPGAADDTVVFEQGFATTTGTPLFREALEVQRLCLPATSKCHVGPHNTWTAIDGKTEHCIDHIAIPQSWKSRCTRSEVLQEFDMATENDDHQAVALQIQWSEYVQSTRKSKRPSLSLTGDISHFSTADFRNELMNYKPSQWQTDAEAHAGGLIQHLQHAMKEHLPRQKSQAKKIYVTDEVWQMRLQKLLCRQKCKALRRQIGRESMTQCWRAWKGDASQHSCNEIFNYGTTLRCSQVKSYSNFIQLRNRLKSELKKAKQQILHKHLETLDERTPASDLLRMLKPFIGPTNMKKQKKKPLPIIHDEDQQPCTLPNEALAVWIRFFQNMEGGQRVSMEHLRRDWLEDLQQLRQQEFKIDLEELPTLVDMELALRRVPSRKARGPDDIPGEICHFHADILAVNMYTQMMKIAIHGQEPLIYKGGKLTPAYKGKGDPRQVSSFRSLLVSSHLGKTIHRCLRQHQAQAYEHFLQAQQLGGRRKVPVQLALHQARAFLRRARERQESAGLLFLDLTEAFYCILRELTVGGSPTDELLTFVMHRLQLPADSLQRLHELLDERTALQRAGLSFTAMNCIRALHRNTHFWLQGQEDLVATYLGTRPGDSFADLIFGFAWSVVLQKLQGFMEEHHSIVHIPVQQQPPFFQGGEMMDEVHLMKPYLGPTWMDDLCLCLIGNSPQCLEQRLGPTIGYLLDLCKQHLMTPNLSKGKTELLLSFRGTGSRKHTVKHYGPVASGHFEVICEHQSHRISIVKSYRHLGGLLHHTSDQNSEVRSKVATAHQAFNQHRKLLLRNEHIRLDKRTEMFNTLVITKLMYGADSWIAHDLRTMRKFEVAVIKLYKRLLRWKHDEHHTEQQILAAVKQPAPLVLMRRARLRYLVVLFQCGVPDIWHLLGEDSHWIQLIEEDMVWMWTQLHNASHLQDPRTHFGQWQDLLQHHPKYWKRLLNRACYHDMLQTQKQHQVVAAHERIFSRLHEEHPSSSRDVPTTPAAEPMASVYGCMQCQFKCRNLAGEGAHMFRRHGQTSILRSHIDQTQCKICLKELHTSSSVLYRVLSECHIGRAMRIIASAGDWITRRSRIGPPT